MDQIFEKFGIHANLLIAQMINFGILVLVLYKLAYKPILNILDQRRDKIEKSLKQAKEIEERTHHLQQQVADQLADAKKKADHIIAESKKIGEEARTEILLKANQEMTAMMEKTKADMTAEKENMMSDIKDYIVQTSVMVVEKVLSEKLDEKTRERVVIDSLKEITTKS